MRLLIVATPKTGNTWLRFLIATAYRLRMAEVPDGFREGDFAPLRDGWVAQQHYRPAGELLAWADRESALFLTTLRHPGDTLLSLFHFVRTHPDDPRWIGRAPRRLLQDEGTPGKETVAFVRDVAAHDSFVDYLSISASWLATGRTIAVRYEDLCRDPERELERVVREIHRRRPAAGLPLDRIRGAVAACEIGSLRDGLGLDPQFFRKGGSGGWVTELPREVIELFRTLAPYPELFSALGYDPDPGRAERLAPRPSSAVEDPFAGVARFPDGTRLSPFLVRLYRSLDDGTRARLRPLAPPEDASSYRAWLGAPAVDDPRGGSPPVVTNLAAAIHAVRSDLQRAFPDPFDADRRAFADWYAANAAREYDLDARLSGDDAG